MLHDYHILYLIIPALILCNPIRTPKPPQGARIMTLEQIEGNEPIHENWGAETGDEIDEVSKLQTWHVHFPPSPF